MQCAPFPSQRVSGRKGANTVDQGEGIIGRTKGQEVDQPGRVDAARDKPSAEQRADFGREYKVRSSLRVVERLDAHGIAREKKAVTARVPDRKGEHPAEFGKTLISPAGISLQQNFSIRVADEACPGSLEFRANIAEVVELAVIDDPVAGFGVVHGLMSERREIENGEATIAQANLRRIRH